MEDNDWETIQPTSSDEDDAYTVVVTTPTNNINNNQPPVVPQQPQQQDNHNHLQEPVQQPPQSPPSSHSSSTIPYTAEIVESELSPQPPEVESTLLKASLGVLSSWVLKIGYGVRSRIGFWSVVSMGAFVAVVAYARRWQRLRRVAEKDYTDKMMLLLNQKDEKIKQLMLQIDRMNETLSVRRRVPVIRVVVDSPVVIGPRLN